MSAIDVIALAETSPTTAAGTLAGTPKTGCSSYEATTMVAELVGATGGTLDVIVQHSEDGTNWFDYIHFTPLASAAAAIVYQYTPALNDAISTIGKNSHALTAGVTLAAGSAVGGPLFDKVRLLMVPGATTTVGAALTLTIFGKRKTGVS